MRNNETNRKFTTTMIGVYMIIFSTLIFICDTTLWDNRFPSPTEATIRSAAYGNGKMLAVGLEGTLLQSYDGNKWDVCYSPIDGNYIFIFYTDAFYIVNHNFRIARSVSGECYKPDLWELSPTNPVIVGPNAQFAPAPVPSGWNKGFVALINMQLYYSYNGNIATWTKINAFRTYVVIGITYGRDQWIAKLTLNGTENIFFSTSKDGVNWSPATDSENTAKSDYSVGYCSTKNVYVSSFNEGIGSSSDGINWKITQSNFDETLHSLACIENRCVGATSSDIFATSSCDSGWSEVNVNALTYVSTSFPVIGVFQSNQQVNNSFIVGGNDGLIYVSPSASTWLQTGTKISDSNLFYHCYEIIYSGTEFVVGCEESVLRSTDGVNWDRDPYTLSNSNDKQVSLITSNNLGLLAAEGESDIIYLSSNNGASWSYNIEFKLHEDDDFDILNIRAIPSRWVILASDTWPISNPSQFTPYYDHESNDLSVYNPFVIVSDQYNAEKWMVFGSNAWINDIVYLQGRGIYLGVGKGGVFTSGNYYQWNRISEVNGECTVAAYDNSKYLIVLCSNIVSGKTDNIVKVSTDNGLTFKNYNSPCTVSDRSTKTPLTCKYLEYLPSIKSFAIYTDQIVGTVYLSNSGGSTWRLLNLPFAVSVWGLADNNANLFVTLSDEVLLSGASSSITYDGPPFNAITYTQSTTAPALAVFPVVGPIASFDTSDVVIDDDDGLSGGAIVGIVFGSIFGAIVLAFFVIVMALGGFILYKRLNKSPEDTALLLYEEL